MYRLLFLFITTFFFLNSKAQISPEITEQPDSPVYACAGEEGTITFTATGSGPLSFQWYKDSEMIVGENSNDLHFPSFDADDSGAYYCEVSNEFGTVQTNIVNIQIYESAPEPITINAQHLLMCPGSSNTLSAEPAGSGNSFVWYHDGNITGYTPNLNISNASAEDAGEYFCIVSNVCGEEISDTVTLNYVQNIPNIVSPPQNQAVCEGEDAVFTAEVEGDFLFYQWLKDGNMMIGEYSDSLVVSNLTYPYSSATYQLVAYNVCHYDTSGSVYITVHNNPVITGNPIGVEACVGEDVSMYATAGGSTAPEYQWYDGNGILENETGTQLTVPMTEEEQIFYCVITNVCGTVTTDTATITPILPIEITEQPEGSILCSGDNEELSIKVNGSEPIYFNWYLNNNDIFAPNITGSNTPNLGITDINIGQEGYYHCVITNACGSISSDTVFLEVNTMPQILLQPVGTEVCQEEEVYIDLLYQGSEPIEFLWYDVLTESVVSEETFLHWEEAQPEDSGDYFVVLSNMCGADTSNVINVNVLSFPEITQQPQDVGICTGESFELSVEATGSEPINYLWFRNNSPLSSETESDISYTNATFANAGEYFCQIYNECKIIHTDTVSVAVGTLPQITWSPFDQVLCAGEEFSVFMGYHGEFINLQWYRNGNPISGANDTIFTVSYATGLDEGYYYCAAYNACDTVYTDSAFIEIKPAPDVNIGEDVNVCEGESVILSPQQEYHQYNWNNGLSYQQTLEVTESGTYILEVTGENGCSNKDTVIVNIHPYHNIIFNQSNIISCGEYMLNAGEGAYSYDWSTGETDTHYIMINESGDYSVTTTGDEFGCESYAEVFVDIREPVNISLGDDVTESVDSYVNLGVEPIYDTYYWNTGFTGNAITVYGADYGVGTHQFWVLVHAENGCHDSDTISVSFTPASFIETEKTESIINIYPNPAEDFIMIESKEENFVIDNIQILSSDGKLVKYYRPNQAEINKINVNLLPPGFYFIKTYNKSGQYYISKVIIN